MRRPSVVIVSPAALRANNGNGRTASRWQEMLAATVDSRVVQQWPDEHAQHDDAMIALHARRSAPSIAAWAQAHPQRGLAVVLTGTDLYQDIAVDADGQRSLELAQRLVVLQECGADALAPHLRPKVRVIFQSTTALPPVQKSRNELHVVMVGHLRSVKSPETLFDAVRQLSPDEGITITHIGDDSGDTQLGQRARETALACPHYEWLGAVAYEATRARIQHADVLVHTSALEGGAHVVMEAVCSGTPVIASRVPGNVGMLGADYAGYFPHGDAAALVHLLRLCRAGQADPDGGMLAALSAQCFLRAPLFDPAHERAALVSLLHELELVP